MKTIKSAVILALAVAVLNLQTARADQPNMQDALHQLRQARAALARAEANKAGHRAKALALVDQAIAEVQAGIDASE